MVDLTVRRSQVQGHCERHVRDKLSKNEFSLLIFGNFGIIILINNSSIRVSGEPGHEIDAHREIERLSRVNG